MYHRQTVVAGLSTIWGMRRNPRGNSAPQDHYQSGSRQPVIFQGSQLSIDGNQEHGQEKNRTKRFGQHKPS
ncbi:Uncharacterized protein HZ326_4573 [Fusarium oxysporum f. sp. albedinis]|nr:Uncharacterized protein HZ326_4573 [Fusarium oxysporum f. sp. albedinis]